VGQEGSLGVTSHALGSVGEYEGINTQTPKWTPILGVRIPMDFRISKSDYMGQNPLDLGNSYVMGKLLERRCLKWVCMILNLTPDH
jgi:hypothetical protein